MTTKPRSLHRGRRPVVPPCIDPNIRTSNPAAPSSQPRKVKKNTAGRKKGAEIKSVLRRMTRTGEASRVGGGGEGEVEKEQDQQHAAGRRGR